ncbi:MAG TPA: Fe-S cluster assembly protein SufD [Xanthomonadales bacterium]|nr:Fe-S cluster assembly protein SufD [Xanthomonadales bacterium]
MNAAGQPESAPALAERWSAALAAGPSAAEPGWLRELRHAAVGYFRAGGLPHRKVEAWKYTPLRMLEGFEVRPAAAGAEPMPAWPPSVFGAGPSVDFVGGQLACALPELPSGVTILSLADGISRFEDRLQPLFENVPLNGATRAFAALNTACAEQGLVVHVAEGVDAGPLVIRWSLAGGRQAALSHPRLILLLDENARLSLQEHYQSAAGLPGGLNVMMQVELGAGARLDHVRVQAENELAVVLTSTRVQQARKSRYDYRGFDLGAGLARHEINVLLSGEGASADVAGAFLVDGRSHVDNHVNSEHGAPDCSSEQFFRGVLGGRSRGVFNGRALIRPGADGSRVRQSNANLLLSPLAEIDTKPELEIYADEVEASHGATVGQLDEVAVFYLRSRGLPEAAARRLLITAFCRAVSERLADRGLSERIATLLDGAMPGEGD